MKRPPSSIPPSGTELPRRDFLRSAGYTLAVAASSCSRLPVEEAIPYLVPPEAYAPGEPLHYATVCKGCPAGCGILATCLEGRPVKLEGNPDHPISRGAMCAAGQASILGLYDPRRLREPRIQGRRVPWDELDMRVMAGLDEAVRQDRRVVVLSSTRNSPLEKQAIRSFLSRFPKADWFVYDPVPASAVLDAHELTHGVAVLPSYRLERADCLVGVGVDFLGSWISPVEFSQAYRDARTLEGSRLRYSYHVQFEAYPTLTGSRADRRHTVDPDLQIRILLRLAGLLAGGGTVGSELPDPGNLGSLEQELKALAERLRTSRGRALLLCGLESLPAQVLTNYLNHLLGAYDRTADLAYPSYQREGRSPALESLLETLERGEVGAMLVVGANPVYDLPFGEELGRLMAKVPVGISFSAISDETSELLAYRCPEPHFLEAWGDSEPNARTVTIQQPLRRRGDSRTLAESLAAWSGRKASDYELLRSLWRETLHPRQVGVDEFEAFWAGSLVRGLAPVRPQRHEPGRFRYESLSEVKLPRVQEAIHLVLRPDPRLPDVSHAANPWLQELPDPLTRQAWGNSVELSPALAERLALRNGDVVRLAVSSGREVQGPVLIQPGIASDCVVIAMGHGSQAATDLRSRGPRHRGRPAPGEPFEIRTTGLAGWTEGYVQFVTGGAVLTGTGVRVDLALAQAEASPAPPDPLTAKPRELGLVQEMALEELLAARPTQRPVRVPELWGQVSTPPPGTPRWGLVIDLGACTGCGACVIACQAENNIPVAGPDESRRRRFMHWLRVDRYVTGRDEPRFHFLPLPCQHCAHAPCEVVCPMAATVRSEDGINVQIYNRCIGTRYCANNCPWKVRAFNWFDYPREGMETLQLNPKVTVRSRGVMEKCSLCIQRIQSARLRARVEGRPLEDGEIQPACMQTCPSRAIAFGDLNDPRSLVSRLASSPRAYRLLEFLGTEPSVFYLKRVLNYPQEGEA